MNKKYFSNWRVEDHYFKLRKRIEENQSISIRKISRDRNEQRQFYRLLKSKKFREDKIVRQLSDECRSRVNSSDHLLVIHDTTAMCYQEHSGRVKAGNGLGPTGNMSYGFYLHPVLVLRAEDENLLGFSDVHIWIRSGTSEQRQENAKHRANRPIEDKEKYKWIVSAEESKRVLSKAKMVTFIADRDSDFYDYWARIADKNTHILSRSKHDRRIKESEDGLFSYLSRHEVRADYTINIWDKIGGKQQRREAKVQIRYTEVTICRPNIASLKEKKYPEKIKLMAIEASEDESTVPKGGNRVLWRLLTTHKVTSWQDAKQIIEWYTKRWYIEQLFRTLKKQGFDCEGSLMGSGDSLRRLTLTAIDSAMKVMLLILARDGKTQQKAENTFKTEELECMEALNKEYEGNTLSQKNPFEIKTTPWVSWIIARMGGWKGTKSERPAGPITMYCGLEKFNKIMIGWRLKNLPKVGSL